MLFNSQTASSTFLFFFSLHCTSLNYTSHLMLTFLSPHLSPILKLLLLLLHDSIFFDYTPLHQHHSPFCIKQFSVHFFCTIYWHIFQCTFPCLYDLSILSSNISNSVSIKKIQFVKHRRHHLPAKVLTKNGAALFDFCCFWSSAGRREWESHCHSGSDPAGHVRRKYPHSVPVFYIVHLAKAASFRLLTATVLILSSQQNTATSSSSFCTLSQCFLFFSFIPPSFFFVERLILDLKVIPLSDHFTDKLTYLPQVLPIDLMCSWLCAFILASIDK